MTSAILDALDRALAALTYAQVEHIDPRTREVTAAGDEVPLLQRSIAQDLRDMESRLGRVAVGKTLLSANAAAIDEALLAIEEARAELRGVR
jgi:hypothetical protein